MQSSRIRKDDYGMIIRKSSFNRNLHTRKYDTFFEDFDRDRRPVMNVPSPDPSDESYATKMKEMESISIALFSLAIILPFVALKYSNLGDKIRLVVPFLMTMEEYYRPIVDGRYDRSMFEWEQIVENAKAHGYYAASRKSFAIKDGKKKYLSPNYIKQKLKVIDKFQNRVGSKEMKICMKYLEEINRTIRNDNELLRLLRRLVRQYYNNMIDESNAYSHSYFYIRHYDPELYKKQMCDLEKGLIKNKTRVTGKIECGPFEAAPTRYGPDSMIMGIIKNLVCFKKKQRG